MTDEETARMNDLARKLADTAIDYKKRCEELEAHRFCMGWQDAPAKAA
jgi:hypothetical protein